MTKIEDLRHHLKYGAINPEFCRELLDLVEMQHETLQLLNSPHSLDRQAAVTAYEETMNKFEEWNKP